MRPPSTRPDAGGNPATGSRCRGNEGNGSLIDARNRPGKIPRREWRQIVHALADADEMHRNLEFRGDGDQDAAARGAVELGHDQTGDADDLAENLNLRQRILPDGGVE